MIYFVMDILNLFSLCKNELGQAKLKMFNYSNYELYI